MDDDPYISNHDNTQMRFNITNLSVKKVSSDEADAILTRHVENDIDPWSKSFADFSDAHQHKQLLLAQEPRQHLAVVACLETGEGLWIYDSGTFHAKGKLQSQGIERLKVLAKNQGVVR